MGIKESVTIDDFETLDIRLGKIVDAQDFPEAKTPRLKLWIDFGSELGVKKSTAQVQDTYTPEELIGKLVCSVVNFPPRQVGPFMSEVLTLGFKDTEGDGFVLITPDKPSVVIGDQLR